MGGRSAAPARACASARASRQNAAAARAGASDVRWRAAPRAAASQALCCWPTPPLGAPAACCGAGCAAASCTLPERAHDVAVVTGCAALLLLIRRRNDGAAATRGAAAPCSLHAHVRAAARREAQRRLVAWHHPQEGTSVPARLPPTNVLPRRRPNDYVYRAWPAQAARRARCERGRGLPVEALTQQLAVGALTPTARPPRAALRRRTHGSTRVHQRPPGTVTTCRRAHLLPTRRPPLPAWRGAARAAEPR
jgi:hypothetical protein